VRLSELTETCGVDDELDVLLVLAPLEEEELLQAAAARHNASDTDAAAAPFLVTRFMSTTSRKGKRAHGPITGF
jgi:hypothetical protein